MFCRYRKGYSGYLVAVYDPSRIHTVVTAKLGTSGQYLTKMAKSKGIVMNLINRANINMKFKIYENM